MFVAFVFTIKNKQQKKQWLTLDSQKKTSHQLIPLQGSEYQTSGNKIFIWCFSNIDMIINQTSLGIFCLLEDYKWYENVLSTSFCSGSPSVDLFCSSEPLTLITSTANIHCLSLISGYLRWTRPVWKLEESIIYLRGICTFWREHSVLIVFSPFRKGINTKRKVFTPLNSFPLDTFSEGDWRTGK